MRKFLMSGSNTSFYDLFKGKSDTLLIKPTLSKQGAKFLSYNDYNAPYYNSINKGLSGCGTTTVDFSYDIDVINGGIYEVYFYSKQSPNATNLSNNPYPYGISGTVITDTLKQSLTTSSGSIQFNYHTYHIQACNDLLHIELPLGDYVDIYLSSLNDTHTVWGIDTQSQHSSRQVTINYKLFHNSFTLYRISPYWAQNNITSGNKLVAYKEHNMGCDFCDVPELDSTLVTGPYFFKTVSASNIYIFMPNSYSTTGYYTFDLWNFIPFTVPKATNWNNVNVVDYAYSPFLIALDESGATLLRLSLETNTSSLISLPAPFVNDVQFVNASSFYLLKTTQVIIRSTDLITWATMVDERNYEDYIFTGDIRYIAGDENTWTVPYRYDDLRYGYRSTDSTASRWQDASTNGHPGGYWTTAATYGSTLVTFLNLNYDGSTPSRNGSAAPYCYYNANGYLCDGYIKGCTSRIREVQCFDGVWIAIPEGNTNTFYITTDITNFTWTAKSVGISSIEWPSFVYHAGRIISICKAKALNTYNVRYCNISDPFTWNYKAVTVSNTNSYLGCDIYKFMNGLWFGYSTSGSSSIFVSQDGLYWISSPLNVGLTTIRDIVFDGKTLFIRTSGGYIYSRGINANWIDSVFKSSSRELKSISSNKSSGTTI